MKEPLDEQVAQELANDHPPEITGEGQARILIAMGENRLRKKVNSWLEHCHHRCTSVECLKDARVAVTRNQFDVIIADYNLPDGEGLSLMPIIHKSSPTTKCIVTASRASAPLAVQAIRAGAADVIFGELQEEVVMERVRTALIQARADRHRVERVGRLKKICRALNDARHEISRQLDSLCNDLTNMYHDVAEQMNEVAMATEFRTLLKQELDAEALLRTTLEFMLSKIGATNAAVFLPDSDRQYSLGAYMNYDCPRETISVLLDQIGSAACPKIAEECRILSFDSAAKFAEWSDADAEFLAHSHVIVFSCRHQGECLATIMLFRNKSQPFSDQTKTIIDTLRDIIGEQLANVIRVHHRSRPSWPNEAQEGDLDYDDDLGFGFEGGLAA